MAESALPELCIIFATADWDEPYWTNKQHCAKALAELGIEVLYVESVGLRSPRARSSRDRKRLWNRLVKGVRSLIMGAPLRDQNIHVLSPLLIPAGQRYSFTRWLNKWLLRIAIKRNLLLKNNSEPLIWTYHPFMLDFYASLKGCRLLYHCVDDLAAVPGVDATAFHDAENTLLKQADVVFATAPALASRCKEINKNTHFLPNVVDAEHFGKALIPGEIPEDLSCIPEPRLGYHGVLSDFKIDFQLIFDTAIRKPEWHWVFIGEEREGQKNPIIEKLSALPNIHFLGYKPYEQLPSYLRGIQVGLLPSLINKYTDSMFPMKYFEYLAAGIPVASTKLSFTENINEGLLSASDTESYIIAIEKQISSGRFTPQETKLLVGNNTWSGRLMKMLQILNG